MRASRGKGVFPTSDLNQLGNPVARRHQRIEPLQTGHTRTRQMAGLLLNLPHPLFQPFEYLFSNRLLTGSLGDPADVVPDIAKALGLEGNDPYLRSQETTDRLLDLRERHSTHLALILGNDQLRLERLQDVRVDAVDAQPFLHDLAHPGVDSGAGAVRVELGRG